MKNWWNKESEDKYNEIAKKIGILYSSHGVNGNLTMGENIADLGAVRISLTALKIYLKDINKELTDTLLQMFVKGWAKIWTSKKTKEEAQNRLLSDPHSPPMLRVNIPLNNLEELNKNKDDIIELW